MSCGLSGLAPDSLMSQTVKRSPRLLPLWTKVEPQRDVESFLPYGSGFDGIIHRAVRTIRARSVPALSCLAFKITIVDRLNKREILRKTSSAWVSHVNCFSGVTCCNWRAFQSTQRPSVNIPRDEPGVPELQETHLPSQVPLLPWREGRQQSACVRSGNKAATQLEINCSRC